MNEFRVTGKTVEDAVTEACIQLGTTSDNIEYEVIEKGSKGLLGFGAKLAVIEVRRKAVKPAHTEKKASFASASETISKENESHTAADQGSKKPYAGKKQYTEKKAAVKTEEKHAQDYAAKAQTEKKTSVKTEKATINNTAANPAPEKEFEKKAPHAAVHTAVNEPVAEKTAAEKPKEVKPLDGEKVQAAVDTFLQDVFKAMHMEVKVKYQIDSANRTIGIELVGENMGVLIGKRGQTLDSLQYLISLVANKDAGDYVRVKLDTENYRRRRRVTLENLAKNIAYKVKRERKSITLEPMNPYERRIIHSTLQNDRYVETHSEGVEPYRRVVVSYKRNADRER